MMKYGVLTAHCLLCRAFFIITVERETAQHFWGVLNSIIGVGFEDSGKLTDNLKQINYAAFNGWIFTNSL